MHEYSIAASLLRMVEGRARAAGAGRVVNVRVRVGAGAGVELDLLRTAWEFVRATRLCRDADLVVEAVPARWVCALCGGPIEAGAALRCLRCDVAARLAAGDELVLDRIEIERG